MASNKEIAIKFQEQIIAGNISEAYEKYISLDFIHHSPFFKEGRESLKIAMEENAAQFPEKIFEVKHVLEDDDLVAIHSQLKLKPSLPKITAIHIFRFENGKIAEEWDVSQQAPE